MACLAGAAWLGAADLDKYDRGADGKTTDERDKHQWMTIIHDNKPAIAVLLGLGGALMIPFESVANARKRRRHRRRQIIKHLELIHARSFPHEGGGLGEQHRISLWVRDAKWEPKRQFFRKRVILACEYRTDQTTPSRTWDVQDDEGLVVRAWKYRTELYVAPPTGDPTDDARYCEDSNVKPATRETLSWKNAGMAASPVITSEVDPVAILLVECKLNKEIQKLDLASDARVISLLLEDPT
jgi:hypothetical protein